MAFKMKYSKGGFPYKSTFTKHVPGHITEDDKVVAQTIPGELEVVETPGNINILAEHMNDSDVETTGDDTTKGLERKEKGKKVIEKTLDPIPVIPPKKLETKDDASLMTKKSPLTKQHHGQVLKEKVFGKKQTISYGNPDRAHTDVKTRTGGIGGGTKKVEKVYDEHGKLISKTKTKTDKKGNVKTKTKTKNR